MSSCKAPVVAQELSDKDRIVQLERELSELQVRVDFLFKTFGLTGKETEEDLKQRVTIPAPAP